jgi:hypothetical protein
MTPMKNYDTSKKYLERHFAPIYDRNGTEMSIRANSKSELEKKCIIEDFEHKDPLNLC